MSRSEWFRAMVGRRPGPPAAGCSPRRGGVAYDREWLKVLKDVDPAADIERTDQWELHPAAQPVSRAQREADAFETCPPELRGADSPEDPWGLKPACAAGINSGDSGPEDPPGQGRFGRR